MMDHKQSIEDYLEGIIIVKEKQGYVRSVDVANQLSVSKPSVSYATKKLIDEGYIELDENKFIILTEKGTKLANDTYDRHKTLSKFFTFIGVDKQQAIIDACKVEHDVSEETYKALCTFINKHCG
jgi:Mn-dependent DtxR family transcriptional regulator